MKTWQWVAIWTAVVLIGIYFAQTDWFASWYFKDDKVIRPGDKIKIPKGAIIGAEWANSSSAGPISADIYTTALSVNSDFITISDIGTMYQGSQGLLSVQTPFATAIKLTKNNS